MTYGAPEQAFDAWVLMELSDDTLIVEMDLDDPEFVLAIARRNAQGEYHVHGRECDLGYLLDAL